MESGEALAGTPRTLALQREPPCKLKQADIGENVTKQLKSRAIAVNEDLPRKMLFSISVCR